MKVLAKKHNMLSLWKLQVLAGQWNSLDVYVGHV